MHFLERDAFVADLHRAAEDVRQGRGAAVAIAGEAGIGKTTLTTRVAGELRAGGMRVFWSACEALFTPRPLGPLYDVADALGGEVDALLAADRNRERLFPAVLAAAGAEPTLLVVEDVHWADHATLDLMKYVVRRIARVPLLLLFTYRDDEVAGDHPLLSLLGETTQARRLALPRLSAAAVATLAAGRDAGAVYALHRGFGAVDARRPCARVVACRCPRRGAAAHRRAARAADRRRHHRRRGAPGADRTSVGRRSRARGK